MYIWLPEHKCSCWALRIQLFLIYRLYSEDAQEAALLCEALLQEPQLDPPIRIGDAFGFLIDHHCQKGNLEAVRLLCLHL